MTTPAAKTESTGFVVEAGGYPFVIRAAQVGAVHEATEVLALPHGPSWLAGMTLLDGHLVGVVDWGRFLGVSRRSPGPLLKPHAELASAWVLQVAAVQVVDAVEWLLSDEVPQRSPSGDRDVPNWADRPRPGFVVGQARWVDDSETPRMADVIDLARLLSHPRLLELAR